MKYRVQWAPWRWLAESSSKFPFSFLFSFPFLVNNLVSLGHPSLGRGMIHLFVSEPHQWFSLTMQRYNIFGRNAIVVPAFESACPGSCDVRHEIPFDRAAVSCVATQEILRGDVVIATWRRRKRGEEGERDQRKRWKSESEKVKFTEVSRNRWEKCQFLRFRVRCKREKKYDILMYTYIIMYARKYYTFFGSSQILVHLCI